MPEIPRFERKTQNRVIALFTDKARPDCLGYDYLGDWHERPNNRCIGAEYLWANLKRRGHSEARISAALQKLMVAADATGITLYRSNLRTVRRDVSSPESGPPPAPSRLLLASSPSVLAGPGETSRAVGP